MGHGWLQSTRNGACAPKELNFEFHFFLINLKLDSHMGLVAMVLDRVACSHF